MPIKQGDILKLFGEIRKQIPQLPTQIGSLAKNFFLEGWQLQGWQGDNGLVPWTKKKDKKNDKPVLVDRGNLRRSLNKTVTAGYIAVKVGGQASRYADIHNFGGTIRHHAMSRVISFNRGKGTKGFGSLKFAKSGSKRVVAMSRATIGEHDVTMPRRQFIGQSKQLDDKIRKFIEGQLKAMSK